MKPCDIRDLADLVEDVRHTLGVDALMYIRSDLQVSKWFRGCGISLQFQVIGDHKAALHMYGTSNVPLKELRNWISECGSWMWDNTECTCVLVYCKKSDRKLRFLLSAGGAKMTAVLPQGNGEDEDELLYVFSKKDRAIYEGRATCHRQ
jgi:hypothetical protein